MRRGGVRGGDFAFNFGRTGLVEVEPGALCSIDYRWTGLGEPLPGTGTYQYGKCASAVYTSAVGLALTGCDNSYIGISALLPASPTPGPSYPPAA